MTVAEGNFLQPKPIKEIKFVGHSLTSITNFTGEYCQLLGALEVLTLDDKKKDEADGFLAKLTEPQFVLTISLVQDILTLLTRFSKKFQQDQATIQVSALLHNS